MKQSKLFSEYEQSCPKEQVTPTILYRILNFRLPCDRSCSNCLYDMNYDHETNQSSCEECYMVVEHNDDETFEWNKKDLYDYLYKNLTYRNKRICVFCNYVGVEATPQMIDDICECIQQNKNDIFDILLNEPYF